MSIRIIGKPGDKTGKLQMVPRAGYTRTHPTLDFELVYGHRCNVCPNLIQAMFRTDKEVRLWPYEETTVLSQGEENMGEILKVMPDSVSPVGYTCYRSTFYPTGAQLIVLKNHVVRWQMMMERQPNNEAIWEVGERTCPKAGLWSRRADLILSDLLLLMGMNLEKIKEFDLPTVEQFVEAAHMPASRRRFSSILATGEAPPMILADRSLLGNWYHYILEEHLRPYKRKTQPKESHT